MIDIGPNLLSLLDSIRSGIGYVLLVGAAMVFVLFIIKSL